MKKAAPILLLFLTLLVAVPQVMAMEIHINSGGTIYFYEDGVLGESDTNADGLKEIRPAAATNRPVKTVSREAERKVKVETNADAVKVNLEREIKNSAGMNVMEKEEMKTNRLRMVAPAGPAETDERRVEQMEMTEDQEYREQVRAERQARHQEQLELRSQQTPEGESELELESRQVKARIKQGAQFQIDPATNQVSVITPSGNVHVLEHLPDQAIERMRQAGLFSDSIDETGVEIESKDTGEVVYTTPGKRRKHIFGFIPRDVDTVVELNDATGEVSESEVGTQSVLGQFLDAVSF